jgi:hypothetical protein
MFNSPAMRLAAQTLAPLDRAQLYNSLPSRAKWLGGSGMPSLSTHDAIANTEQSAPTTKKTFLPKTQFLKSFSLLNYLRKQKHQYNKIPPSS